MVSSLHNSARAALEQRKSGYESNFGRDVGPNLSSILLFFTLTFKPPAAAENKNGLHA
jgi:hypothetical protein